MKFFGRENCPVLAHLRRPLQQRTTIYHLQTSAETTGHVPSPISMATRLLDADVVFVVLKFARFSQAAGSAYNS
ncbi:hypothetical protein LshimejAT787_2100400 [Lyophyllum shimeji]|uniref:Uncharacterized protein n=1 Tax=Lyophyllum shimeji TaxID=47721 RepID=A0A9P3UUZ3_LYOSH|nr:hypothetical protein LshimejAT787_2100400 [Lyophyllum shimeji]